MDYRIIAVRVTESEHAALQIAGAKAGGLRPNSYLRKLAGFKELKPGGPMPGSGRPKKKEAKNGK